MPTYPSISPLPPAPNPDSPATFNSLAYPFTAALQTLVDEINAFSDAFEILISDAQHQALQIPGVNGQLLLPTLTGSGAAAATTLSPAMRAALALPGTYEAMRIPLLNGLNDAEMAIVGEAGRAVLSKWSSGEICTEISALRFVAQSLTTSQQDRARANISANVLGAGDGWNYRRVDSHTIGVSYTNTTGYPLLFVAGGNLSGGLFNIVVNGRTVFTTGANGWTRGTAYVPPGWTFRAETTGTLASLGTYEYAIS